jgi:5-oxoprolinase (ATP-hydrolysing) subunit C
MTTTIEVFQMAGLATVQDGGRPGHMHQGVPPGGALVPELLAMANLAAGNAAGEPAVELFGSIVLRVPVTAPPLRVAADREPAFLLGPGDRWSVTSRGARARYLAVQGAFDVPMVLGGRGTFLLGAFGGHEGRALRKGDRLLVGSVPRVPPPGPASPAFDPSTIFDAGAAIHVVPGPDLDRFAPGALDLLLGSPFEVSPKSDRVGARLLGAALPRADSDAAVSGPMVLGAIQVPGSGEPIVLGPDHPTTGGYPVIATVCRRDLGALMARPIGASVRFVASPA